MMVLVDTSAWIEYLRGTDSSYNTYVREAILADRPPWRFAQATLCSRATVTSKP